MEKLKPEHRRIWRRVYFLALESGSTTNEATEEANAAVQQWEQRGAFDEAQSPAATLTRAQAWAMIASIVREKYPTAFDAILNMLVDDAPQKVPSEPTMVIFPADCRKTLEQLSPSLLGKHVEWYAPIEPNAIALRALTPYGDALLRVCLPHTSQKFVAAMRILYPS